MANRFWVGGTGTWDASDTTHWAAITAGAGGQSVPSSADAVTFDASSGGGTVTVNTTVAIQNLVCGAFTGTLDFSANDNNVTLSSVSGFNGSGTGTRTINLGDGTWTLTATSGASLWTMATTTNLTFNANNSTIHFSGTGTDVRGFSGGALTYHNVTFAGGAGGVQITGGNTFGTLTLNSPNFINMPASATQTISTLSLGGTSNVSNQIALINTNTSATATVSISSGTVAFDWAVFRRMTFGGGATFSATNALDLGLNSGITISAPAAAAATGGYVIGG